VLGGEHGDEEEADRVVAHALKQVQVLARDAALSLVTEINKWSHCAL
jgi:hypothetical protein